MTTYSFADLFGQKIPDGLPYPAASLRLAYSSHPARAQVVRNPWRSVVGEIAAGECRAVPGRGSLSGASLLRRAEHVRPQVVASHLFASCLLDSSTTSGRHRAYSPNPLIDRLWRNIQHSRQSLLPTNNSNGF